MELARYLQKEAVFLNQQPESKEALLAELVAAVVQTSSFESSFDVILERVLEREKIRSTGFGRGLAVAHARMDHFPQIGVAIARLAEPIDWEALDGQPVEFVVLVVGETTQEATYLQILSEVTKLWARKETRALLLSVKTKEALIQVIAEAKSRTHPR